MAAIGCTTYARMIRASALALMAFGVVMIYSAGACVDRQPQTFDWLGNAPSKQLVFAAVAFLAMLVVGRLDYRCLSYKGKLFTWPGLYLLVLALALLAAVYIPALSMGQVKGARRWLRLGTFSFQPSEFAKFAMVVFLAGLLSWREYPRRRFFAGLLPLCAAAGVVCALIGTEDFGTAALIALVAILVLSVGGVRIWHMIVPALPAAAGFGYLVIARPHRLARLTSFTKIWTDPEAAYHPLQSLIAIGSGGWLGVGLGRGMQKYGYLPEDTSDFIFSIICEELGMPGALLVMGLIAAMVCSTWQIFRRTDDAFGKLLCVGIIGTIGLQAVMNIAVATVSVPTKGIGLPLISAGGSGMIFSAVALGLICSVARFAPPTADYGGSVEP